MAESTSQSRQLGDYKVGWICALPVEASAARGMLDDEHDSLPQPLQDSNCYFLGRIGVHNVIIACLPAGVTGTISAANVAFQMRSTFTSLRFGLMVGVGGGAPSVENDIRLGDIVVGKPAKTSGGVIQYDFGKAIQEGQFERTGSLNRPPDVLLSAVSLLQAKHSMEDTKIPLYLEGMFSKYPRVRETATYMGSAQDRFFEATYEHPSESPTCGTCDCNRLVRRKERGNNSPALHYGLIASGNQVMRNAQLREKLRKEHSILCFEMEAAGLMDTFPCLVVRGICDYADSHKNKIWQPYAAATAAAYAKELLYNIPESQVIQTPTAPNMTAKPSE